ncbi:MAG: TetR/AcrR family transcriptional regulator [Nocardiaceae bacterium]|nr:TetR/AcrR family transcriptional regulator [Nocardiaceae bacterium]
MTERDSRRTQLIEAAARLVSRGGVAALSARNVAAEAGMSTKPVYSSFGSMEALLRAVVTEGFDRLERRIVIGPSADPLADIATLTAGYLEFARTEPSLYAVMFGISSFGQSPAIPPAELVPDRQRTFDRITDNFQRAIDQGRIQSTRASTLAYRWWVIVHGFATLETAEFIGRERGVERVLAPLLVSLFAGEGDDADRARESVAAGLSSSAMR